jgi:hypothetical protein
MLWTPWGSLKYKEVTLFSLRPKFVYHRPRQRAPNHLKMPTRIETTKKTNDAEQSAGFDYMGRAIKYSQMFNVADLYKALTMLLESSLASAQQASSRA